DTAKGGYGIKKLVSLLRNIHGQESFRNQFWEIDIHLLYPNGHEANIDDVRSVELLRNFKSKFQVNFTDYPVPEVVGEDYDEASDFDYIKEGNLYVPKPRVSSGGFLLEDYNGERLIETDNVFLTLDEFFSEAVTQSLLSDPNRALAEI